MFWPRGEDVAVAVAVAKGPADEIFIQQECQQQVRGAARHKKVPSQRCWKGQLTGFLMVQALAAAVAKSRPLFAVSTSYMK